MCEPDGSHKVQQVEQEGTFNAGCMSGKERASKLLPTMLYDGVSGYPVTRHDKYVQAITGMQPWTTS